MSVDNALVAAIELLKQQRNAVVLAHYYQSPDIQDIADFIGYSLELSRKAANTSADVIVFCGVHFMAETAKILSPEKTVVIPDVADEMQRKRLLDSHQLMSNLHQDQE